MVVDSVPAIAVVSSHQYRAESLALALSRESNYRALAVKYSEIALLPRFSIVLIEIDADMRASLEATRTITARYPDVKVILLGFIESEDAVVNAAEAGASGYISPENSFQELISIMQSIQKDEFVCTPAVTYTLFSHLTRLSALDRGDAPPSMVLTARERQIVELMSYSFSNKEIAERLFLSRHTVKNHIHRISKKLQVHKRMHIVRYCQMELAHCFRAAESRRSLAVAEDVHPERSW